VDIEADLRAPCTPDALFAWVRDLERYPTWHEIVTRAEPLGDDIWQVDLRGKLGPLARTKRLRMRRTMLVETPTCSQVVFERDEVDGRNHSPWRLTAEVAPSADGSRLHMVLHYGGSLWGPVLERVLGDEIERSRTRLLTLVEVGAP
jgi:hypothetical protein